MSATGDLAILRDYEHRLRAALAGVPAADVDDIVDEVRSHLSEQTGEGAAPAAAVAAFGEPESVAGEILSRRLQPEGAAPVPPAPTPHRALAWLGDFALAWGPLIVYPWSVQLVGWMQGAFLMPREVAAELAEQWGYTPEPFPFLSMAVAAALAVWGVWYWRVPRRRSVSPGMRMAGLSRVRASGRYRVVRTFDLAASEPARIVSRPKWYLAPPLTLLGTFALLAGVYYGLMIVGSVTQPTAGAVEAVRELQDSARADDVIAAFYEKVIAGDVEGAQGLVEPTLASQAASMANSARILGLVRVEPGESVGPDSYVMHESYGDSRPPRVVVVTVARHDEQREAGTYATVYRISSIEETTAP